MTLRLSRLYTLFVILVFFILSFAACTADEPDTSGPVSMEAVTVDYISNESAYFTADFSGQISLAQEAGFCWSDEPNPVTADDAVSFEPSAGIKNHRADNFLPGKTYYMRAYYMYNSQVYYSPEVSFTTTLAVSDKDQNQYTTVKIGAQEWMMENLAVKTYNNGEPITDGSNKGNYSTLQAPKFYFNYSDSIQNSEVYGRLYTWHVVTDQRGVCPAGWRIPDLNDWEKVIGQLDELSPGYNDIQGGLQELSAIAGGMMRSSGTSEAGTGLWQSPNQGATNLSQFSMIPSGFRDPSGAFDAIGYSASFWTYTESNTDSAMMVYTHYFNPGIHANEFPKSSGYAVRCVK